MSELLNAQTAKVDEAFDALIETTEAYIRATSLGSITDTVGLTESIRSNILEDASRLHKATRLLTDLEDLA